MTREECRNLYVMGLARNIPRHMHPGIVRYMEHGADPGVFLTLMLMGEYKRAMGCIDYSNLERLDGWNTFLATCLPEDCHGSMLKFAAWRKIGGLAGLPAFVDDMETSVKREEKT